MAGVSANFAVNILFVRQLLVAAGIFILFSGGGISPSSARPDPASTEGRAASDATLVRPVDSDQAAPVAGEKALLRWKLREPKLSLEGFELIVTAASGGLAKISTPVERYAFADYMFAIDSAGIGLYWEEVSGSRSTDAVMNGVLALFQGTCAGKSASGEKRRDGNDTFTLRQGFVSCEMPEQDSYMAVSVLNFGAVTQVFAIIGYSQSRDVLDLINSNISDVEIKVFGAGQGAERDQ